jgi:hypothetical protein
MGNRSARHQLTRDGGTSALSFLIDASSSLLVVSCMHDDACACSKGRRPKTCTHPEQLCTLQQGARHTTGQRFQGCRLCCLIMSCVPAAGSTEVHTLSCTIIVRCLSCCNATNNTRPATRVHACRKCHHSAQLCSAAVATSPAQSCVLQPAGASFLRIQKQRSKLPAQRQQWLPAAHAQLCQAQPLLPAELTTALQRTRRGALQVQQSLATVTWCSITHAFAMIHSGMQMAAKKLTFTRCRQA